MYVSIKYIMVVWFLGFVGWLLSGLTKNMVRIEITNGDQNKLMMVVIITRVCY